MKKHLMIFAVLMAVVTALVMPMGVTAANSASQSASTSYNSSLSVVAQTNDTPVSTITFPAGAPSTSIDTPFNNTDTVSSPQILGATGSKPVVRISNATGSSYNITLQITDWTNSVVAAEYYNLANSGATDIQEVTSTLSSNGLASTVATSVPISSGTYKDLYLRVSLGSVGNKNGTSTLTILGES
jgi:hypothetical protein